MWMGFSNLKQTNCFKVGAMANQNYLSPSFLVTVLLILSRLTPAQGSGCYNSSTVSSQQVNSSRAYSPSYIHTTPSTLSECHIADSLVVLASGDTVASTSSVDTQTYYFQVLFQTTSTRKAAVAIVLDYIHQQTDIYMVESCTNMFQNQSLPYRNLGTADQKNSYNMYAIETQYKSSSAEPSCDSEDSSYYDCFVMQQNISFYCLGTCSTQSKRLVENSLHDYLTTQLTSTTVRIDWTTGTKLLRIHDYNNARSSNYMHQIQGNSVDDSSTNHTLPLGRTTVLLLAALIVLISISSVLLFLLYNKREVSEPAFAQFDNRDDEQNKIMEIWENSLNKYPMDTASTISAPMINGTLHFMEEGAPSTFLPNGNYAIEIGKEQRRMDDNSSYSSTSTAEYLLEGESWDESSSLASSIQNSILIAAAATTALGDPTESFHQSHIPPISGSKTEATIGKKSILRNNNRARDVAILNSETSRRVLTRKTRDPKLTVSFEPFSLVLPPLLSDNDDDNNVEILFDAKEESLFLHADAKENL